ncbi:LysR family transcriptional regulator [Paraburkholderia nemoris]|uniref:LysR family transcriptional regulator n=2 Tax=Burkholderiaceae TaxID=119060 RepID=UPI0038B7EA29
MRQVVMNQMVVVVQDQLRIAQRLSSWDLMGHCWVKILIPTRNLPAGRYGCLSGRFEASDPLRSSIFERSESVVEPLGAVYPLMANMQLAGEAQKRYSSAILISTRYHAMELRHLRHFVAVAETRHFGRAAARLGMAQPPLSQSIMRLEESLGIKLLERTPRGVSLTAAGEALMAEAKPLLAQADLAERRVRQAADELASLSIAFVPMCAMHIMPLALHALRKQWPGVDVRLIERGSALTVASVKNGSIDLGVVVTSVADVHELESIVIERMSMVAAVPANWPLAQRTRISMADLTTYPLIMFPQQISQPVFAAFEAARRDAGVSSKVTQQARHPYTMLNLVANELGVGLMLDSARHLPVEGVVFIDIEDLSPSLDTEVSLIWTDRPHKPYHRAMLDIIRDLSLTVQK